MMNNNKAPKASHELLEIAERAASAFGFTPLHVNRLNFPHIFVVDFVERTARIERLFLKYSGKDETRQIELCHALEDAQISFMPHFVKTRNGETCVQLADRFWTCQSFVPADVQYDWLEFNCSNIHCAKAGEALGQLHANSSFIAEELIKNVNTITVSDLLDAEPERLRLSFEAVSQHLDDLNDSQNSKNPAENGQHGNEQVQFPAAALDALKSLLLQKDQIVARAERLCGELIEAEYQTAPVVNHGDYHCSNLVLSPTGVKMICDWEYACIGSPLYDLSYALYVFCFDYPKNSSEPPMSTQRMESFLDGYSRYARLSTAKMRLLDAYMEYAQILIMRWLLDEFVQPTCHHSNIEAYLRFFKEFLVQCSNTRPAYNS